MGASGVSLEDMLAAREQRVKRQRQLIEGYGLPVVCFTMNIAGGLKRSPLVERAFNEGVRRIERALMRERCCDVVSADTGCEAYLVFDMPPEEIKRRMIALEERDRLSRLFDIDVIDVSGEKLSRGGERECLVCGGPVTACARSRAHGLDEVIQCTDERLIEFAAEELADFARDALVGEVSVTPKPGLVDRDNSGSHDNMDLGTFILSANALRPYYRDMAAAGMRLYCEPAKDLLAILRAIGLEAERAMLEATGGVNTHRGLIYSLGLLVAGSGKALRTDGDAVAYAAELATLDLDDGLKRATQSQSHGGKVYACTGILGARGEAAGGFVKAKRAASAIGHYMSRGISKNDAAAFALSLIMAELDDTNVVYRGGMKALNYVKASARMINALPTDERIRALRLLDAEFISVGISPGGAADVLAVALFMLDCDG